MKKVAISLIASTILLSGCQVVVEKNYPSSSYPQKSPSASETENSFSQSNMMISICGLGYKSTNGNRAALILTEDGFNDKYKENYKEYSNCVINLMDTDSFVPSHFDAMAACGGGLYKSGSEIRPYAIHMAKKRYFKETQSYVTNLYRKCLKSASSAGVKQ